MFLENEIHRIVVPKYAKHRAPCRQYPVVHLECGPGIACAAKNKNKKNGDFWFERCCNHWEMFIWHDGNNSPGIWLTCHRHATGVRCARPIVLRCILDGKWKSPEAPDSLQCLAPTGHRCLCIFFSDVSCISLESFASAVFLSQLSLCTMLWHPPSTCHCTLLLGATLPYLFKDSKAPIYIPHQTWKE